MRNASGEQKWRKRLEGAGAVLELVDSGSAASGLEDGVLDEIRILLPGETRGDVLIVLKGHKGNDKYVAFVGGPDVVTACLQWKAKELGQGVKWRTDEWQPPTSG